MAKSVNPNMLDAALDYLADNGTRMDICATEPTTYTEATSTNSLGNTTLVAGDGNGDYTVAAGDVSGRKVTISAQTGISVTSSGTADHVAITDGTSELIYVTTLSSGQSVTSGNTADVEAWDVEIEDPT